MSGPLLAVRDLKVELRRGRGSAAAVDGLSFEVFRGETLALVGESGCGKSVTMQAILGLLPARRWTVRGQAIFAGEDLVRLPPVALRSLRGRRIGMVFQDATAALNPVMTVGSQIAEVVRTHEGLPRAQAWRRAVELLDSVRVPDAAKRAHDHPHRLSGGTRQRAMIAMALANDPELLIADEPTTALDVTIQDQILDLLAQLQHQRGMALLLVTHDLGVVASMGDRAMVMYAGRKVEEQPVALLLRRPLHPYTAGLIAARPRLGGLGGERHRLQAIPGGVPPLGQIPSGCAFRPRCPLAAAICERAEPALLTAGAGSVACHMAAAEARLGPAVEGERHGRPALAPS